jgi:hypothetical protein
MAFQSDVFQGNAFDVLTVTEPAQLPAALDQRAKTVVIEHAGLERRFAWIEFWQGREGTKRYVASLIAALFALALALQYKLDIGWQADWKLKRVDGKIILTPK